MINKLSALLTISFLSLSFVNAEWDYYRTLLDFNDTDGGVVQGSEMGSQYGPHGVVVAPDGHVWVNINRGEGRMEILDNGDTIMYKPIYVLDPATGEHASFSPIEVLTFPDGSVDTLHAGSATSGSGVGIALSADGHILSSHFSTLYKINYMTGEGVAMWVGPDGGALTEAAADDNGNVFVGYVISAEKPVVVLDENLNYVGNAIDQLGHINRTVVVTPSGEDMLIGSTWNGHGFTHWNSAAPGAIQHSVVDTFGVYDEIDACYEYVGSGSAVPAGAPGDSAYVLCDDEYYYPDTTFDETALWVSALDLSPDGETLIVGALTAVWGGPLGGTNWLFDMDDLGGIPYGQVGNWHNADGTGEGVTDGPRGAAYDADGNLYLADYYGNAIYHYAADYSSIYEGESDKGMLADGYSLKQNYPNPFNPSTKIEFSIPVSELVNLTVYDLEGKIVKTIVDRNLRAGQHVINWDGTNDKGVKVSTGMYLYQLRTNTLKMSKMMTFIK